MLVKASLCFSHRATFGNLETGLGNPKSSSGDRHRLNQNETCLVGALLL